MTRIRSLSMLAALVAFAAISGCAGVSDPTRFYTLSPATDVAKNAMSDTTASIGVGPITFPRLLNRPQIVTRKSSNEVQLADFHQWGGSLEEDFGQVLADNIAAGLELKAKVYRYPWQSRQNPTYQVVVVVDRFDGALGDVIELRSQWQIIDVERRAVLRTERPVIRTTLDRDGYDAYAMGMSRALAQLSAQIAAAMTALKPR